MRTGRSIRTSGEFRRLVADGRRARRDGVTVHVGARPESHLPSRLGIAVKASGAVARNRARRRLRAAWLACGLGDGFDVVVRGDESLLSRKFQDIVNDLRSALAAAGVTLT